MLLLVRLASSGQGGEGNSVRRVVVDCFFSGRSDGRLGGGVVGVEEAVGKVSDGGVVVVFSKISDGCSNLLREALQPDGEEDVDMSGGA